MTSKRFPIVIERTATGFCAWSPDVSGCFSAGDTEDEARRLYQEALEEHLDLLREIGGEVPEPNSTVSYVDVAA